MKGDSSAAGSPKVLSNSFNTPNILSFDNNPHQLSGVPQDGQAPDIDTDVLILDRLLSSQTSPKSPSVLDNVPNEIISLILDFGYFDYTHGPLPNTSFRSSLLQTSRRLWQLTIHTPSVWSVIKISHGNIGPDMSRLPLYLTRSRDYPLHIDLRGAWRKDLTRLIAAELLPHSKRWRRLCVVGFAPEFFAFLFPADTPTPILQFLDISFFAHERRLPLPFTVLPPRLTHLKLRNVDLDTVNLSLRHLKELEICGYGNWPKFSQLRAMLDGNKSLEKVVLHVIPRHVLEQVYEGGSVNVNEQISLPELLVINISTSEGLSQDIANLSHLFAFPKLQSMTISESASVSMQQRTILNYSSDTNPASTTTTTTSSRSSPSSNVLFVHHASVSLAFEALPSASLTKLELRRPYFSAYVSMQTLFQSLTNLKTLLVFEFNPNENEEFLRMPDDLIGTESSIFVPTLETLVLDIFRPNVDHYHTRPTSAFLSLFTIPSLRTLTLKNAMIHLWPKIAKGFPNLTSLKLVQTEGGDFTHFVDSFPHLQVLSLDGVISNSFFRHLVPLTLARVPLPELHTLAVCNDANVSKPLFFRMISTRKGIGVPLVKVRLDSKFSGNADSWDWVRENVEVEAEGFFLNF